MLENKDLRDRYIVEDYKTGKSISEIGRSHSLSERRVGQILKDAGVTLRQRRPASERRSLSRVHEMIGRKQIDDRYDKLLQSNDVANSFG